MIVEEILYDFDKDKKGFLDYEEAKNLFNDMASCGSSSMSDSNSYKFKEEEFKLFFS